MKVLKAKEVWRLMMVVITFLFVLPCPGLVKGGEIPSFDDMVKGKEKLPTIEELTDGKVKTGDLIDANNVDLVKDYISTGVYESVKKGMVLIMGEQLSPDQITPGYFREITEKNRGKAIMDKNAVVYYEKTGTPWPGGLPFCEPKTGLEVAANVRFGNVWDELQCHPMSIQFVNPEGKLYKASKMKLALMYCTTRTKVAPLEAIPGFENILYKRISVMREPLENRGLGQYTMRFYDDSKEHDAGFMYFPAFKRTMRISMTTWQDNVGGSDMTFGDGQGLQEPYAYWDFKLSEKKYVLMPAPTPALPVVKGEPNREIEFDAGKKYPRLHFAVWPVHAIEAIPKTKHVYGKKVLYTHAWPYWPSSIPWSMVDIYDGQGKLWKLMLTKRGFELEVDGQSYVSCSTNPLTHDLQTGHMTQMWGNLELNKAKFKAEDLSLQKLLWLGR